MTRLIDLLLNENNKLAAEKLLKKNGVLSDLEKGEFFKKFYELDPTSVRYPDNPKFLITLIKWFLEDPTNRQYTLIKTEFETYLEQSRLNQWRGDDVVIKDISKFPKFSNFATEVHRISSLYRKTASEEHDDSVKVSGTNVEVLGKRIDRNDITYPSLDDVEKLKDIVVIRADNMAKSKLYGCGLGHGDGWCTAKKSGNYFYEYRFGNYGNIGESTLYYVYFPTRYSKNPEDDDAVLHFGVNDQGEISFTNRSNDESTQTLSWLKNNYEEFSGVLNMKKIFPHIPITTKERTIRSLDDELTDEEFYNLSNNDKLMYLQSGDRIINLNKFNSMNETLKSNYLGIIENSNGVLHRDVFVAIRKTAYGKRYITNTPVRVFLSMFKSDYAGFFKQPVRLEIILSIIENKKNNLTSKEVFDLLMFSSNKDYILKIGDKLTKSNIDKLESNQISHLLKHSSGTNESFTVMLNLLQRSDVSKVQPIDVERLISNISEFDPEEKIDRLIEFVLTNFSNFTDSVVNKILLKARHTIKYKNDNNNIVSLFITDRQRYSSPFSDDFVYSMFKYATNKTEAIARIVSLGYDIKKLQGSYILHLFEDYIDTLDELETTEKILGSAISNLSVYQFNTFFSYETKLFHEKLKVLIKYNREKIEDGSIVYLFTRKAAKSDLQNEYIELIGKERLQSMDALSLYSIIQGIEDFAGFIKLVNIDKIFTFYEINSLYNVFTNGVISEVKNKQWLDLLLTKYTLSAKDLVQLLQIYPETDTLLNTVNRNIYDRLDPDVFFEIWSNSYIEQDTYKKILRLFGNKLLELPPKSIANLLRNLFIEKSLLIFDFLREKNYDFHNEEIVVLLSRFTTHGYYGVEDVAAIVGVNKISQLDNKSIIDLITKTSFKIGEISFLLKYIPLSMFTEDVIVAALQKSSNLNTTTLFKTFEENNLLSKITPLGLQKILDSGQTLFESFINYYNRKNELTNPDIGYTFLVSMRKYSSYSILLDKLNIESWFDKLSEKQIHELFRDNTGYSSRLVILFAKASLNVVAKLSDENFDTLAQLPTWVGGKDNVLNKLKQKPNLNAKNVMSLFDSVGTTDKLNDLNKNALNQLTQLDIITLLYRNVYLRDLLKMIKMLGSVNMNKLDGTDLYNLLIVYVVNNIRDFRSFQQEEKQVPVAILSELSEFLYKIPADKFAEIETTYNLFGRNNIDLLKFLKNRKITTGFENFIKSTNYVFLQWFTKLYFRYAMYDGFHRLAVDSPLDNDIQDYLKVIGVYIKTHNNTLNYTEFESIMRVMENYGLQVKDHINIFLQFLSKTIKTKLYSYLRTYNAGRKYNNKVIKEYKRYYADLLFENSSFSQENLDKALDIERKAYPPHMQFINSYIEGGGQLDVYDIADYLECNVNNIVFHMGSNWFILGCVQGNELEIADWASDGGMSISGVKAFFSVLRQYKDKTITCNARETTSYRLIKKAEKIGYLTILDEQPWSWGGVTMIDMKFKFNENFMNKSKTP